MNNKKYLDFCINNEMYKINCKDLEEKTIKQSMKLFLSRRYFKSPEKTISFLQSKIKFENKKYCAWCGKENNSVDFDIKIIDNECFIENVRYQYDLNICKIPKVHCDYKKLNPNSIIYVSKSQGVTEEEANRIILERNTSPFYRTNYSSNEDYVKYQSFRHPESLRYKNDEEWQLMIEKQNKSRSRENYIKLYGSDEKYIQICNEKARSLENFKKQYGEIEGQLKYDAWKNSCKCSLENFQKRHGEIEGELKYDAWKDKIKCSLENFKRRHGEIGGQLKYESFINKRFGYYSFGTISFTDKNETLRSNGERYFYEEMKKFDLHLLDYKIEKNYPNSSLLSDFCFTIGSESIYIEIAGMMGHDEYRNKMVYKESMYNAIIIKYNGITDQFKTKCKDVCLMILEKSKK